MNGLKNTSIFTLAWLALSNLPLWAEDKPLPEIKDLEVYPTTLELNGARDSQRILVTGITPDGKRIDVTAKAQLTVKGDAATLDADRYVAPNANGEAAVEVAFQNKTVTIPVKVLSAANTPVSFVREVMPVMTKLGCNQGSCHGGQQGKAGFKLSLRGYDPEFDYTSLIDDLAGRRFNRADPEQSLMLLKPTQGVPHEGGFLMDENSRSYHIIRQWIAEGCQLDSPDRGQRLEVYPKSILLGAPGENQSHVVLAYYADGTKRDVTRDVNYDISDFEKAVVDKAGVVTAVRRGEATVLLRYEGLYTTNVTTILGLREGYAWNNSPEINFIDTHVNNKLKRMKVLPSELCSDAEFLRRVMIDLTGTPPTGAEARAFLADSRDSKTKREAKVDELLNSPDYFDNWTMKWSDLLMSNRKYISEKGVWAYRQWIRNSIANNVPYDVFVRELMTANGSTFENPAANYYRISREPRLVMENMTQVFLGTRFMCAQCHDHPFERWTQGQYHELSAFFSGIGRKAGANTEEEVIFSQPGAQGVTHPKSGKPVEAKFPYTFTGFADHPGDNRGRLTDWLVSKNNPYFAKSITNRYWSYFMGRGIIDPVDDIRQSNPPSNPELLEALTNDFLAHNFDLKNLIRTIVTSHTYQRSLATNDWNQDDAINYSHALPRRLGAEQLYDAIITATGAPMQIPGVPVGFKATQLPDGKIDLSFLDMFGRPPRESPCECERTSEVSLSQTLNLINGPTIGDSIIHPQGLIARLVAEKAEPTKMVEEIYLSVLVRLPTADELAKGVAYVNEVNNPAEAGQDLMWALINSPAFLFNR